MTSRLLPLACLTLLLPFPATTDAAEPSPPPGFRAIFNGKDLTGWYGLNPHAVVKLQGEKREANLKQQREDFPKHWRIEDGELVNDGTGPYATTEEEFGDIEFLIEYKTVPKADSGIYLRGTPQVQIWDYTKEGGKWDRNADKGSGGLFNNSKGAPGQLPLVLADKPFGEWNAFRIKQVGSKTWVWLNDLLVVDGAVMENYWDRTQPLPAQGPIMLQTHGGEIRWRNLFVREIGADEARQLLSGTVRTEFDVVVYGGTPAGIAAAVAAAKSGRTVLLAEPTPRIGGLVTSGLSHTDFHSFESLSGTFLEFAQRVEAHYAKLYGPDSEQVRDSFRGTFGEPKVNLAVFEQLLTGQPNITVRTELTLQAVDVVSTGDRKQIRSATFQATDGAAVRIAGSVFIDGTYEGDLMAAAGVPWRVGREGRDEYDESLAPEQADGQLQAYNFRFIMTKDPENRVTPVAPPGYRREDFVGVLGALESGQIRQIFGYPRGCIFKAHLPVLPNGKYDINDVSTALVRLSLPGKNLDWPDGDAAARQRVFAEHVRDQVGLLYFLQNDDSVPAHFRDEAREWGWCRDEFTETVHLPPQLYVREARRMVGVHVFTQRDSEHAPGDARAVLHRDAIAMGDYGNNCHGTLHEGPRFGGKHSGEFYNPAPPYQIPYGVLLPREVDNLLVPVAASSTHVGFCALRLEPIWMSLGQAAGHAAALAVSDRIPVQQVSVSKLQRRLHEDQSATIYVSDVLPGSPDFAAVQWWGTRGGLHGLAPMPAKPGQRGKNLHGQYYEANPGHAADLEQPLTLELAQRWRSLAAELGLPVDALPSPDGRTTRGDFIKAAAALRPAL